MPNLDGKEISFLRVRDGSDGSSCQLIEAAFKAPELTTVPAHFHSPATRTVESLINNRAYALTDPKLAAPPAKCGWIRPTCGCLDTISRSRTYLCVDP